MLQGMRTRTLTALSRVCQALLPMAVSSIWWVNGQKAKCSVIHAYLIMVAVKEGEEAGLSASSAFHPTEPKVIAGPLDVSKIPQKFLS